MAGLIMLPGLPQFDSYELVRRIGLGGMGEVYEARLRGAQGFSKRLAIKLMLPHLQRDREAVHAFIDEATIAAGLSHPNLVAVYDFGQCEGSYYIAMEYVDGWVLRDLSQLALEQKRRLPVPAAAYVVAELASALAYLHGQQQPIVHRDVTPQNIFVTREGHVKLSDFGVAKTSARLTRTEAGQIKGKLAYLAPEQARGEEATGRTDVYGAGRDLARHYSG